MNAIRWVILAVLLAFSAASAHWPQALAESTGKASLHVTVHRTKKRSIPRSPSKAVSSPAARAKPPTASFNSAGPSPITVEGEIVQYQLEKDGDFRLVILDAAGKTYVAWIPDPSNIKPDDPRRPIFASLRQRFYDNFHPTSQVKQSHERVRVALAPVQRIKNRSDQLSVIRLESFGSSMQQQGK